MSRSSITVSGLSAAVKALRELPRDIDQLVNPLVEKSVQAIEDDARARAPFDEFELRNDISSQMLPGGNKGEVKSAVDHSVPVEFGTEDTPAQPFMFPAFQAEVKVLRKELRALVADLPVKLRTRVKRDKRTRKPKASS